MAKTQLRRSGARLRRFLRDVAGHTRIIGMVGLLVTLWLVFSVLLFTVESASEMGGVQTLTDALYWGIAAFSTAGIADTPQTNPGKIVGGIWIIVGSTIFFGTIVATITMYFMRPLQRPVRRIVDTIEYNLEQIDQLSPEELELLKKTTDTLFAHVERLHKQREEAAERT